MDTKTFDRQRDVLREVRSTINGVINVVQWQLPPKAGVQDTNLKDAMQRMAQARDLLLEAAAILSDPNDEHPLED